MTFPGHQLIVCADFHEPGAIQHEDEVGHTHRREAVRDEDGDAPAIVLPVAMRCCGIALEQGLFGLRIQRGGRLIQMSNSGSSRMNPRASASFCHCPNDSSTPPGHVGPSCVSRPAVKCVTTSTAPARSTAATTA